MAKRISKKFDSFEAEEKWLMDMAKDGWRLVSYDSEDLEECTYKFDEDPDASKYNYQIDYRNFNTKSAYEEYKALFEETGWTILSKSFWYSKHIFVSTSKERIFSDSGSILERDINRYKNAKMYVLLCIIGTIITGSLYFYFDSEVSSLGGVTIMGIFGTIYATWDAMKHRKKVINAKLSI